MDEKTITTLLTASEAVSDRTEKLVFDDTQVDTLPHADNSLSEELRSMIGRLVKILWAAKLLTDDDVNIILEGTTPITAVAVEAVDVIEVDATPIDGDDVVSVKIME